MESDISVIIRWWFYILLIGVIFLPLARLAFDKFFDRGYIFSKAIGIGVSSYIVWLLSALKIAPFYRITIFAVLIAAFIFILIYLKGYRDIINFIKENKVIFILEEIAFLLGIFLWCYIRGLQPDIYGLEKFMDFGFVNSILKTEYMPPLDIWLAGKAINYYYFGHYVCAFLVKLIVVEPSVGYNIMLAMIFSFTMVMTFSLAANIFYLLGRQNIRRVIAAGIISSMLVTFGGNLHTFVFATAVPFAKDMGWYKGEVTKYFYADSTRYIGYNPVTNDKTIHEFPFYSFVVSDLHGHVSNIPFVLTIIAFILAYIAGTIPIGRYKYIAGIMLAIFYMTNAWDFPIYLTVSLFAFLYKESINKGFSFKTVKEIGINVLFIFILSQLFMLPYSLNFENIAGGVGLVYSRTPIYQLLVLWGYQILLMIFFIVFLTVMSIRRKPDIEFMGNKSKLQNFFLHTPSSDIFVLILLISAFGLVLMPEVVYVRDIYGIEYHRANTMFKLVYQSFIMFGIAAGYIAVRTLLGIQKKFTMYSYSIILAIVIALPMMFPFYAVKGYYSSIKPSNYKGLYGLDFLKKLHPDDYEAVKWLNSNIKGQPVILEASGEGYTDYERISMTTGLPTVLGWFGHEWLWRGGPEIPTERSEDITAIYESDSVESTMQLVRKYEIEYIIIGKLERDKFKSIKEDKILKLGETVFNSHNTQIIKIAK